jgi:hypothetical protein
MMLTAAQPPYLTDAELADICAPLVMPAAQVRYLERLGLMVRRKPNGRPLVARSEFDRVLGAGRFREGPQNAGSAGPDVGALMKVIQGGRHHGAKAQGR